MQITRLDYHICMQYVQQIVFFKINRCADFYSMNVKHNSTLNDKKTAEKMLSASDLVPL